MTVGRILFSEWAEGTVSPRLIGSSLDRRPCPICGHPTMDCTHHVPYVPYDPGGPLMPQNPAPKTNDPNKVGEAVKAREGVTTDRAAEATAFAASNVSPPVADDDTIVIGSQEGVSDFESAQGVELVTLTKTVVEEFYFPDTKRPSYRTLYNKGDVVKKSVIDELNARAEAGKKAAEVNPAGIDTSTLQSGTVPGIEPVVSAVGTSK